MSASTRNVSGVLRCGAGSSVVAQSISSIASSGSRRDGSGFPAAVFQSLFVSPRLRMARNSAAVCFTMLPDFLLMRSSHRNDANGVGTPCPHDCEVRLVDHRCRFPSLLRASRRGLMDGRPAIEEQVGRGEVEGALFEDATTLAVIPFEIHIFTLMLYIQYVNIKLRSEMLNAALGPDQRSSYGRSLRHDLHLVAGLQRIALIEPVQD